MKKIISTLIVVGIAGAAFWYFNQNGQEEISYRFIEVEQGNLESTIGATGTLSAVSTVEVGTQASGQIAQITVDYNDSVKKGELIARIDPTLQEQAVRAAEADLERSMAEVAQREREYTRNEQLYERQVITESEFYTIEYNLAVAKANLKSNQVGLERAQQNLSYTYISAPVDGVVIERNVDVGQTVAASLSAPTLFLIAEDLSQMEILVSVDESDIGQIQAEQAVRFTVQAYPEETFHGAVRQVRLQSSSQENVVNYTVVVDVDNSDGTLLPGMTATVDFLIETATDVLNVANAALRFRPTEEMTAQLRERRMQQDNQGSENVRNAAQPRRPDRGNAENRQRPADTARLWYLDADGNLAIMPVRTGTTNGQSTAIQGPELEPGLMIITGVTQSSTQSGTTNPFQTSQQGGGPPRPGF
ncbi:MAG: efflux RND transporter periplasmic adaptor subunit [Bacteroidota bacterium]